MYYVGHLNLNPTTKLNSWIMLLARNMHVHEKHEHFVRVKSYVSTNGKSLNAAEFTNFK